MRPVIGITCSRVVGGAWGMYSLGHFMDYTFSEYSEAISACGGAPLLIPSAQNVQSLTAILGRLSGLLLSGGPDIHPRFYGEEPREGLGEVDEGLDRMELEIARMAYEKEVPILAVCRGIQTLNVALGGSLYQDLPSQVEGAINHSPKVDKAVLTHPVQIEKGTVLFRVLGKGKIWVNGKHHQAIKEVASGLTVTARAPDGVIEGVEASSKPFVLGVQWHPEGTWKVDPPSKKLFRAFVQAAKRAPLQGQGDRFP